ncbi:5-formyltetrahydrofolate cyclo-ligase [Corynebacterium kalidii]
MDQGQNTSHDATGDTPDAVQEAKQAVRRRLRAARRAVTQDERARRDAAIIDHLLTLLTDGGDGYGGPGAVAAFVGLPGEPGGPGLPEALRQAGFEVWLPVVPGPSQPLTWLPYRGSGSLRPGAFGIPEPTEIPETPGPRSPISCVELSGKVTTLVVPALAVDRDGTRLGQGGGYYDRTAAVLSGRDEPGRLVALVDHDEFGVDVPRTRLDVRVRDVVTDAGVFPTSPGRRSTR